MAKNQRVRKGATTPMTWVRPDAREVAVGLALIVALYRTLGSTDIDRVRNLHG